ERVVGLGNRVWLVPISRLEGGPEFGGGFFEPNVRAMFLDQVSGLADDLGVEDGLAFGIVKRRDGDAPSALARDAPIWAAFDGGFAAPAVGVAVVIILLMQEGLVEPQFMQHGFVGLALAMLFENGFAEHVGRHLLLDG